jgi:hypothetical protein
MVSDIAAPSSKAYEMTSADCSSFSENLPNPSCYAEAYFQVVPIRALLIAREGCAPCFGYDCHLLLGLKHDDCTGVVTSCQSSNNTKTAFHSRLVVLVRCVMWHRYLLVKSPRRSNELSTNYPTSPPASNPASDIVCKQARRCLKRAAACILVSKRWSARKRKPSRQSASGECMRATRKQAR